MGYTGITCLKRAMNPLTDLRCKLLRVAVVKWYGCSVKFWATRMLF